MLGKENQSIVKFKEENIHILGITEANEKGSGEMEIEGRELSIYKEVNGNSKAKEVHYIIDKIYKRFITEWIGATERIPMVELKMKEDVTLITCGSN